MKRKIPVVVTVNTKEQEACFLRDAIRAQGFDAPIIDVSTQDAGHLRTKYPWTEVCLAAGMDAAALSTLRRDEMMHTMGLGAGVILLDLCSKGELAGVISIGGNQGTAIAAIAMRGLPIGLPKVIISTVASGQVRPYVEYSDIMMMFSVADFVGNVNFVNRTVMSNGAAAVTGMALHGELLRKSDRPVIAATAFGNTDVAVSQARRILEEQGYEVVGFHASGAGGSAMEYLIERGYIQGVLDLTTHELIGEVCGDDIYTPLRPRLLEAGRRGIPQVVAPGGLEYFCFGGVDDIPVQYKGRLTHYHNLYNTNVRASRDEVARTARVMAEKLNAASGPVVVLLPTQGFSANGAADGVLYDPDADLFLREALKVALANHIRIEEIDANINDAAFSQRAANCMAEMMGNRNVKNGGKC